VDESINRKLKNKNNEKYIDGPKAIIGFKKFWPPSSNISIKINIYLFCNIASKCLNSYEAPGRRLVLQKVRCGKNTCHCAKAGGELHGPYWYYYWKKDGRTRSKYIGKSKPVEV
jgi:hypothetical protein